MTFPPQDTEHQLVHSPPGKPLMQMSTYEMKGKSVFFASLTEANSNTLMRRETPAVAKSSLSRSNSMLQVGKKFGVFINYLL